jgi:hypothetical protein
VIAACAYLLVEIDVVGVELDIRLLGWPAAKLHAQGVGAWALDVVDVEVVVVRSRKEMAVRWRGGRKDGVSNSTNRGDGAAEAKAMDVLSASGKAALELVEDAIVLVQIAQLGLEEIVYANGLHRPEEEKTKSAHQQRVKRDHKMER